MSQKKTKKRKNNKKKTEIKKTLIIEIIGIFLMFLAIFMSTAPFMTEGIIPKFINDFFRFFVGVWYFIWPIIFFALGLYLTIKRKWPRLKRQLTYGLIFVLVSLFIFTHAFSFSHIETNVIISTTWHDFWQYVKNNSADVHLGSGFIGSILYTITRFLLSDIGAKILAVFMMIIGIMLIFNISLSQVLEKLKLNIKNFKRNKKQKSEKAVENTKEKEVKDQVTVEEKETPMAVEFAYKENETGQLSMLDDESEEATVSTAEMTFHEQENDAYLLPQLELLTEPKRYGQQKEKSQINNTAKVLEETFESFGVKAKITAAHVGPAVTKYEVLPEAGVKVSKILNLHDDLALALAAQDIRIEAPIPGKSAIGIEVPNESIAMVSLREVLQNYPNMTQKLLFGLGKDISGNAIVGELNKMPHLLIAGATGSGKSVCINGIITSILMRAKPNEVKMMMIDPKKVELNVYNGIPHLLTPVVTDPKKASIALRKILAEMEHRYELFSETATRNIESYNQHILMHETEDKKAEKLPYIVVLVDELADLMMVASKDVEESITRLAQMARAAGIHLIIATQRPSVDVITGVIKANIPSRIAFSVSSQVDSRTILDVAGAEKLLGRGDMLYIPVGQSKPIRVQGAFLSDEEVEKVVNHCVSQQKANYQEELIPKLEEKKDDVDELFDDAVKFVVEKQSASVSMLQRQFRVGYTRAARLVDQMEERKIIGPYEGNKPRMVYVDQEEEKAEE